MSMDMDDAIDLDNDNDEVISDADEEDTTEDYENDDLNPTMSGGNLGIDLVFEVGLEAVDDEDAYNKYNAYAYSQGFGIRKSHIMHNKKGNVRLRKFLCYKQGVKDNDGSSSNSSRGECRTGCRAHAWFTVRDDGVYYLSKFCDDHNHPLVPQASRHHLRSHRKIKHCSRGLLTGLHKAGVGLMGSYKVLSHLAGGYDCVGFTSKDSTNFLGELKQKRLAAGDCQAMLSHFNCRKLQDPLFFFSFDCDKENRITNVFWRDGFSARNYEHFGDVVVFDTTFRTNRYDMACAPFVGVNNHWANVFFGVAFLKVENTNSFKWLFQTFRESMGGVAPKTIFTDQDASMSKAIADVFPESCHRLCIWHIAKNASKHIGKYYVQSPFRKVFNSLLFEVETPEEFEDTWARMIVDFNLEWNRWLGRLYELKLKWAPAYGRDVFRANIHSTQRSESANNVFRQMTRKCDSLCHIAEKFEQHMEYLREEERKENFRCFETKPKLLLKDVPILENAANLYTHAVFSKFQKVVLNSYGERIESTGYDATGVWYVLRRGEHGRTHFVHVDYNRTFITCSCKLFEIVGFLCQHAVKVMDEISLKEIPERHILRRWTRDVKFSQSLSIPPASCMVNARDSDNVIEIHKMMRKCFALLNLSADHNHTMRRFNEVMDDFDKECKSFRGENNLSKKNEVNEHESIWAGSPVRDPVSRIQKTRAQKRPNQSQKKRAYRKRTTLDPVEPSPSQGNGTPNGAVSGPSFVAGTINNSNINPWIFTPNPGFPGQVPMFGSYPTPWTPQWFGGASMSQPGQFTQLLSQTGGSFFQPVNHSHPTHSTTPPGQVVPPLVENETATAAEDSCDDE